MTSLKHAEKGILKAERRIKVWRYNDITADIVERDDRLVEKLLYMAS